jgi:hypothetical protein
LPTNRVRARWRVLSAQFARRGLVASARVRDTAGQPQTTAHCPVDPGPACGDRDRRQARRRATVRSPPNAELQVQAGVPTIGVWGGSRYDPCWNSDRQRRAWCTFAMASGPCHSSPHRLLGPLAHRLRRGGHGHVLQRVGLHGRDGSDRSGVRPAATPPGPADTCLHNSLDARLRSRGARSRGTSWLRLRSRSGPPTSAADRG